MLDRKKLQREPALYVLLVLLLVVIVSDIGFTNYITFMTKNLLL